MKTIKEIIDFAIAREIEAAEFYDNLSKKVSSRTNRQLLEDFVQMEYGHAAALRIINQESIDDFSPIDHSAPAITEFLSSSEVSEDISHQEIVTLAMKREDSSFKLYTELSKIAKTESLTKLLLKLADEEMKHKKLLEHLYEDEFYKEN